MCGIAGLIGAPNRPIMGRHLGAMISRLSHRGPDGRGFFGWYGDGRIVRGQRPDAIDGARAALAHRRLAIIDLSENGAQPMSSIDGLHHVVLNGEIYNYVELRLELEARGRRFRSASDTEVLLQAYAEWGRDSVLRLEGMFAFALLDLNRRILLLVRDFFGIKPLFYALPRGGLAFASEIKSFLHLDGVSREADARSVGRYVLQGVVDDEAATFFKDIRQIPAAHLMEVSLDAPADVRLERYWRLPEAARRGEVDAEEAAKRLRELFVRSVELHLRSDVPVGAALSGGIDSSAIVMGMRQVGGGNLDIHGFTYVSDDPGINEERWADRVGDAARVLMHKVRLSPEDLFADLDRLISAQDEPFGSTSIYAQYRVFQAAHDAGIKVMLDGQGADEMLAGYRPHLAARAADLLRHGRVGSALSLIRGSAALPGETLSRTLLRVGAGVAPGLARLVAHQPQSGAIEVEWFAKREASFEVIHLRGRDSLREFLTAEFEHTSLPALLRYEDRNSMAHSIESRVPFLIPALVEFIFSMPEDLIVGPDATSKWLLREALRDLVPEEVLIRRDKIGFRTPEANWLRNGKAWAEAAFARDAARAIPFLHIDRARAHWDAVQRGERRFDWRIWRWLNLVCWTDLYDVRYV